MGEAYHRALMAFPDEDVVVGSRFVAPDALAAFDKLDDVIPSPGATAVGEERAWGRRLAKRFGVDRAYDATTFVASDVQSGYLDFEAADPSAVKPEVAEMFQAVDVAAGQAMIVY